MAANNEMMACQEWFRPTSHDEEGQYQTTRLMTNPLRGLPLGSESLTPLTLQKEQERRRAYENPPQEERRM